MNKYSKPCEVEDCDKYAYQRKRCYHHYRLLRISQEPDFMEKEAAKAARQRENNPEAYRKIRQRDLLKHYDLTPEAHDAMLEGSYGQCGICEQRPEPRVRKDGVVVNSLCIDHCHKTGLVRGLLCHKCNSAIGYMNDDVALLQAAVEYLLADGSVLPEVETAF
jgi:hypothetical protein